ncbi:type VI secretion protein ImpB [Phyllobacterium sp. BT25]|uniref:DNA-directed DNA polymerase n=1 Tax=Phyllobacterium pellucidum TaxID=2740464 RepID=A0A849VMR6_9HYPH|nr:MULTISPECIES: type VI secretion protein ImpB [Phyllobacterium]NTS31182.1 type VI secretion protein ImpB [Phyllobacterium pellucidum]UGY08794.1 type VI secretion protein ImpB [Phyllobacterium sp. T1018]
MRKPTHPEKLYLDFDSFFASAEQQLNPALQGRPIAVVPLDSPYTSVIAASREAKPFGVKTGTSVREAREKCPDIVFIEARPDVYVRLHNRILEIIERCVPIAAVRSIDELACTLLESEARQAAELSSRIKRSLRHEFGPVLTCSIGISFNELLAKVAAEMDKPDGFVVLDHADLPGKLLGLALRDLPGISKGMETRLIEAGVTDIAGLWALAPKHARAIWNSVEGERFVAALHGYSVEKPETITRMFGHGRNLPPDWRTPQKVLQCARLLTMSAARRLRRSHHRAGALTYTVGTRRESRTSMDKRFRPARDDHTFLNALNGLHEKFVMSGEMNNISSVTVVLHELSEEQEASRDLFDTRDSRQAQSQWERVSDVLDTIRVRHGSKALNLGPANGPGNYIGSKIAFGRIPAAEDF